MCCFWIKTRDIQKFDFEVWVLLNTLWLHAVSRVCSYVNKSQFGLKMYVWNPIEIKEREKRSFNSTPSFTHYNNNMLTLQALYWKDSSTHAYSSCLYIVTLSIYSWPIILGQISFLCVCVGGSGKLYIINLHKTLFSYLT